MQHSKVSLAEISY